MLLSMRNITKDFGPVRVLHGVDFEVRHGEIHALVGHNGAGKSTLMKVLGGNFADYGGSIEIEGQALALHSPAEAIEQGVAMIYQDFALARNLTVADNIALGREPPGKVPGTIDHDEIRRRSAEEARKLGIELPMNRRVGGLGVAAQQLTEIVRACAKSPRILVMDEPTARLAPAERERLFAIMAHMAGEHGIGIVYISHFLEEVTKVAHRITILRDGRVVESGARKQYDVGTLSSLLVGRELEAQPSGSASKARQIGKEVLTAANLTYPGQTPISFTLCAGEILGIAGLVGSGRTRFARALVGDLESRGVIKANGKTLHQHTPETAARAGLVMVPEDRKINGLAPNASIEANIAATALQAGLARFGIVDLAGRRKLAAGMIGKFGIHPPHPQVAVGNLSGGNAQKVLVARALAARPKVLVLDQPTAGVDIGAKAELHALLKSAADEGAAIILISDELEELIGLSDRILVLAGSRLDEGPPVRDLTPASLLAAMSVASKAA